MPSMNWKTESPPSTTPAAGCPSIDKERCATGACRRADGFTVVLTADRGLMADYGVLFDGMLSASQTVVTPSWLIRGLLAPSVPSDGVRAVRAPLGLRRIEAALAAAGGAAADIAVVAPGKLSRAIGRGTRVIGLSSGDPLGLGMNSTTMEAVTGAPIRTRGWFRRLSRTVQRLRRRAPEARVVMGGPGAWQLTRDPEAARALGVDHIITGYCEANVGELFARLAEGEILPPVLAGRPPAKVPAIRGAAVMGGVEIGRGCGLGCRFCTLARVPMRDLPVDTILSDVETNLAAGPQNLSLISEDLFRYGAEGMSPRPAELIALLSAVRRLSARALIQVDHGNIASAARFDDNDLCEVRRLLVGEDRRHEFLWINLGVETASGRLLADNGGLPKMRPFGVEEWGGACLEQVHRLVRAGYFPLVSLMAGLPGETPDDVERTLRWVAELRQTRAAIFPLLYAPIDGEGPAIRAATMSKAHWRLFQECYRLNFKWMPHLCWDNQSAGGVPLWRRVALQVFGRAQVVWWKSLFAWRSGRWCR